MTPTIEFGTGSLSLFDVAKQTYDLIPDDCDATIENFPAWCKFLWNNRASCFSIVARFPRGVDRVVGFVVAHYQTNDLTKVFVKWILTTKAAASASIMRAFILAIPTAFPMASHIVYDRHHSQRIVNIQRLIKRVYGK